MVRTLNQAIRLQIFLGAVLRHRAGTQALDPVPLDADHAVLHEIPERNRPGILRNLDLLSLDRSFTVGDRDLIVGTEIERSVFALEMHDRLGEELLSSAAGVGDIDDARGVLELQQNSRYILTLQTWVDLEGVAGERPWEPQKEASHIDQVATHIGQDQSTLLQ